MAIGRMHSVLLGRDGSIYSWGLGLSGQLGHSYEAIYDVDVKQIRKVHPMRASVEYVSKSEFREPPLKLTSQATQMQHAK